MHCGRPRGFSAHLQTISQQKVFDIDNVKEGHEISFDTLVVESQYIISRQNNKYLRSWKNVMTIFLTFLFVMETFIPHTPWK